MYPAHKVLDTECKNWPWPLTLWPKINRVPPLIIHNLHLKFESDREKTVVCIVSTRQSATDARTHSLTQPPTNGCITISPPTLLRGNNKESKTNRFTHNWIQVFQSLKCANCKKIVNILSLWKFTYVHYIVLK